MSLLGAASRDRRPCYSMLKAWELPELCQELVAEPQAQSPLCQALTEGFVSPFWQLLVQGHFHPSKLGHGQGGETSV